MDRNQRQRQVYDWARTTFGEKHASSQQQRAIRFLEEAIELYQACNGTIDTAHKLIDYVFENPSGEVLQELGGVGVTLLALAEASGISADVAEDKEVQRVLALPQDHFRKRNKVKNDAGFNVS